MKKVKRVLPIMLASALVSTPFIAAPKAWAIDNVDITADDNETGVDSEYEIEFQTEKALDAGDKIYIKFDKDFELDDIDDADVEINGDEAESVSVSTSSNTITIEIPEDIKKGDVSVGIYSGITNPDDGDDYTISVKTSKESSWEEGEVTIDDDGGSSSDDEFNVDIGDDEEGEETTYELGTIDLEDDLEEGEWVTVIFPDSDMVPDDIDTDNVEINGYEVDDIDINGKEVELKIPEDANNDDELDIEFLSGAGITNPDADDDYEIKVEYAGETYYSEKFDISEGSGSSNSSSDFTVSLSDTAAAARSSYTFEADFGSKKLYGGDQVTIEFPNSEMIPGILTPSDITLNGKTVKSASASGNKVYLTAPSGFTSTSGIKVIFSYTAWVTNPKTTGNYSLKMTVDSKTITSKSFAITGTTYTPPTTTVPPASVNNSTATIGLTNSGLNGITGVNVAIKGLGLPLAMQRDFIEIVFPLGYRVPAYITPAAVSVNGVMANYVAVRGQNVLVYPTQNIPAGTAANVVVTAGANIVNPAVKNAYSISVFSSEEKGLLFARAVSVGGAVLPVATPAQPAKQPAVPSVVVPTNAALIKLNVASFTLHGKTYPLTAAPYLANGSTTMMPAQFFKEALALTTLWDSNAVSIISGTKVVKFTVGSNKARVGSQEVTLTAPVQLKNGMPMIPIKFAAENLGYKVGWDAKTSSVFIYR